MGTSARNPAFQSKNVHHRGLFLVPAGATAESLRSEAADVFISRETLAHAHRIVAEVAHRLEVQAASKRAMSLHAMPRVAIAAIPPQATLVSRAARAFGL